MFKFGTQPKISISFKDAEVKPKKSIRVPGREPQEMYERCLNSI